MLPNDGHSKVADVGGDILDAGGGRGPLDHGAVVLLVPPYPNRRSKRRRRRLSLVVRLGF